MLRQTHQVRGMVRALGLQAALAGVACGSAHRDESIASGDGGGSGGDSSSAAVPDDGGPAEELDVGAGGGVDSAGGVPTCYVQDDLDGVGDCDEAAPPGSFQPDVQWAFTPDNGEIFSVVTPLVANLTDDDGNGTIDLCDTPDVVVVLTSRLVQPADPAHVYVLDGETGAVHFRIETGVKENATPAIADLDADGTPEIVTAIFDDTTTGGGRLVAFEPDGTVKWTSDYLYPAPIHGSAVAIADADADGSPEILYHDMLYAADGTLLWDLDETLMIADASTFADLDGDGMQEIVFGHSAVHADGSTYFASGLEPGFPAVADLDADGKPEILLTNSMGITMLEHDGTVTLSQLRPTGVEADGLNWSRPATIHDFDGDGAPELALSSRDYYSVFEADGTIDWSSPVLDASGFAAGTAFDFLGDGRAEAMYADESTLFVFGEHGEVLLSAPRASHTLHEYPVVADIDNDGSAEIVVISEDREHPDAPTVPSVQAIRDVEDRWIQARRIWNQHTYHVTNVREDATIPQHEVPHWTALNTFRTNAQLSSGGDVCKPVPEG